MPSGPGYRNLHLLLVEDNPVNQLVAQEMLTLLGCEVYLVEDGGDHLLADTPQTPALIEHYAEAAGIILALQSHGVSVEGPNPELALDGTRLRNELEFTEEHALRGWLENGPEPRRRAAFDTLAEAVASRRPRSCGSSFKTTPRRWPPRSWPGSRRPPTSGWPSPSVSWPYRFRLPPA